MTNGKIIIEKLEEINEVIDYLLYNHFTIQSKMEQPYYDIRAPIYINTLNEIDSKLFKFLQELEPTIKRKQNEI